MRVAVIARILEGQMDRDERVEETWEALRTDVTRSGESCFVSNLAFSKLERHGTGLTATIEAVVGSPEFESARQAEWLVEQNTLHLMLIYFEQADAAKWDTVPFLRSLGGPMLHKALVAVFLLWGPSSGTNRRQVMPRTLYEEWHMLIARDPDWIGDREQISKYHAEGSLSLV